MQRPRIAARRERRAKVLSIRVGWLRSELTAGQCCGKDRGLRHLAGASDVPCGRSGASASERTGFTGRPQASRQPHRRQADRCRDRSFASRRRQCSSAALISSASGALKSDRARIETSENRAALQCFQRYNRGGDASIADDRRSVNRVVGTRRHPRRCGLRERRVRCRRPPAPYLRLRTRSMIVVLGRRFSVPFFTKRPLMASRTRLPGPAPRFFAFLAMKAMYPDARMSHRSARGS